MEVAAARKGPLGCRFVALSWRQMAGKLHSAYFSVGWGGCMLYVFCKEGDFGCSIASRRFLCQRPVLSSRIANA
jgi:hypothetical protein